MDLNEDVGVKSKKDLEEPDDEDTEATPIFRNTGKPFNQNYNEGGGNKNTPCKKSPEVGADHTPLTSNITPAKWKSESVPDSSHISTDENQDMKILSLHTQIEDIDK